MIFSRAAGPTRFACSVTVKLLVGLTGNPFVESLQTGWMDYNLNRNQNGSVLITKCFLSLARKIEAYGSDKDNQQGAVRPGCNFLEMTYSNKTACEVGKFNSGGLTSDVTP